MWSTPVGEGAKRTVTGSDAGFMDLITNLITYIPRAMLIGAHVSTAGGLNNALERGEERRCESIQIFNQSPRMWRPTRYSDDDFSEFREALKRSPIQSVAIHMIYLIN